MTDFEQRVADGDARRKAVRENAGYVARAVRKCVQLIGSEIVCSRNMDGLALPDGAELGTQCSRYVFGVLACVIADARTGGRTMIALRDEPLDRDGNEIQTAIAAIFRQPDRAHLRILQPGSLDLVRATYLDNEVMQVVLATLTQRQNKDGDAEDIPYGALGPDFIGYVYEQMVGMRGQILTQDMYVVQKARHRAVK